MLPNHKIADYLKIAVAQRSRQQALFVKQFGADSAAVKESAAEVAALNLTIAELTADPAQLTFQPPTAAKK